MDITLGMLLDPLQDCTWNIQREEQLEQICRGVELLPRDGGELKEDVVYLTDSYRTETVYEVYQACPFREKLCLLYICALGEEPVSVCSVSIETPRELSVILNQMVGKFFQYMNWERDLDTCILKNAPMEQLLDTAVSMIGSPIQLYDPSLKLIASSSMDSDDMLYQEIRENHGLNRKTAEYLSEINFFPPDDVDPSPILLYEDSPISPYVQLFYRVDVAGRIKAIVYVVFSGKAYSPIAVRLMHLLVEKVGIAVEQNDILDSGFVRKFDLKLPHPKSCFFDYDEYTLVHMATILPPDTASP